jgi:serine/threonine protein kinase
VPRIRANRTSSKEAVAGSWTAGTLVVGNVEVSDVRPFAEDLVGMAQLFQGVHTANGTAVLVKEMKFSSEEEMRQQQGEAFLHEMANNLYGRASNERNPDMQFAADIPHLYAAKSENGVWRLVMKKLDMSPVVDDLVVRDVLRDIVQTNKVTPRSAAFSVATQVLRSLVSTFKIIGPHILHGDVNARNVLFMRKWALCQLNENGDGGHSWIHYKNRAIAESRARDLSAQGLLVEGPKVTIKAGLVDFGLSRQQQNWLWPRGHGPFEGLWTPPNDPYGRDLELKGIGGWAFMRVAGDFRYCPPSSFQAAESMLQQGPPGFGLHGFDREQYVHGLDAFGVGCTILELLMQGLEELSIESRREWDHLSGSWKQYRNLVDFLQSLIRSSNWPAFLAEESSRKVREALEQVFAALSQTYHAAPEEQAVLRMILRLMQCAEPVNWHQLAYELSQWCA